MRGFCVVFCRIPEASDELKSSDYIEEEIGHFRRMLLLLGLDTSWALSRIASCGAGILFIIVLPVLSYFFLEPSDEMPEHEVSQSICFYCYLFLCLESFPLFQFFFHVPCWKTQLPFQMLVILMETSLAAVSFLFIHITVNRHGLVGLLFLDYASTESLDVQHEYKKELKASRAGLFS